MYKNIRAACVSHIGKVRKNNEDNFFFDGQYLPADNTGTHGVLECRSAYPGRSDRGLFYAVFDGMGGAEHGEIASYKCAEQTQKFFSDWDNCNDKDITRFLEKLCSALNTAVFGAKNDLRAYQMGSTIASVYLTAGQVWTCNVGDSKCYWYCRNGHRLRQMSADHTDEHSLSDKPMLTQYLGIDPQELSIEPSITYFEPEEGDRILLCSDGLTDMLSEENINKMIGTKSPSDAVKELLNCALEAGGHDNITILLVEIV